MSLLRFVAASRVWTRGFGLYARCGVGEFFSVGGDDILKSNRRGAAFTDRSERGEDRGGVYGE